MTVRPDLSSAPTAPAGIVLSEPILARLMPMYLRLDAGGAVVSAGPTLRRVCGLANAPVRLTELFDLRRPTDIGTLMAGGRVDLALRGGGQPRLRGMAVPLPDGGVLLDLSFGLGVTAAVRDHALTEADFATTDLTVELLWLVEANAAVSCELRSLNRRLQGAQAMAQEQALTDALTGLRNRRALEEALADWCAGVEPFALVHLDLDRFKAVNDTQGHAAGDHVLCEVARILAQETRAGDLIARMGGDEFVLLLADMANAPLALQVAERIVARLARPIHFEGARCDIGASAGLVLSPARAFAAPDALQRLADAALYAAKRAGRGRVVRSDWP